MSQYFFESMMSEDIPELFKMFQVDKVALVFLSDELMILRQTDAAASLLGTGIFHSVEGILSIESCCAIRLCLENHTDQTITELLDNVRYSVKIHPVKDGVFLYFSLTDGIKSTALLLSMDQNQKMRDSLALIMIATNNIKRQSLDEKGHSYVGIVKQNSLRLLRSLEHASALRSPFYQDEMNFCEGDISELLAKIQSDVCRCLPEAMDTPISLDCPESLPAVFDSAQITTVIYNLISNSLKYGGSDVKIILKAELNSGSVYLSVIDNGPGMPDDAIERSCEDYCLNDYNVNTNDFSCDCGIGIPLARKIASCHSGILFIGSKLNKGTTATIAFPADLPSNKILNQLGPAFTSSGFNVADIELSTFLPYDFYK